MAFALAQLVRSRWGLIACLGVLLLAAALPPQGFGVPLCQFRQLTGLPCPGCGLTRSVVALAHLDLQRAAFYHPAGFGFFGLAVIGAGLLLSSGRTRLHVAAWLERRAALVNWTGGVFLGLALAYGAARIAWVVVSRSPSPW